MTVDTHSFIVPDGWIRGSATFGAGEAAKAVIQAGHDVISFTLGDLFAKPSDTVKQGWAHEMTAAQGHEPQNPLYTTLPVTDKYAPSDGGIGLRSAAAYRIATDTGLELDAKHVCIGSGGKGTLNGVCRYFKKGDQVFVAAPGWPSNYDVFPDGVELIEVDTKGRGLISPEQMEELLSLYPGARGILINSPNNPTSNVYPPEERERLMMVIRENARDDFLTVSDEPYAKLVFDDGFSQRRGRHETALFEGGNLAIVKSMSKEYGLAGIRIGYVACKPPSGIEPESNVITLVQWNNEKQDGLVGQSVNEAHRALLFGEPFIARTIEDLQTKRDTIVAQTGTLQYATTDVPRGSIYGWVDFAQLAGMRVPDSHSLDGHAFTIVTPADAHKFLVEVAHVNAIPAAPFYAPATKASEGSPFGWGDWHMRITFAGKQEQIEEAFGRIRDKEPLLSRAMTVEEAHHESLLQREAARTKT